MRGRHGGLRDGTFQVLSHQPVTCLAGHRCPLVATGRLGSGGATPTHASKGDGTQRRRIHSPGLPAGRLEKHRVSGQTDRPCTSSTGLPAASCVTGVPLWPSGCATRCSSLVGGQPHTSSGGLGGSVDFFFSLSPLASSQHVPASHPPPQLRVQWGREQPRGNTLLCVSIWAQGTTALGTARHALIVRSAKSKQGKSRLSFLPVAKGYKSHRDPVGDLYWGKGQIDYLMIWLGFGVFFNILNTSLPSFAVQHKSLFQHMHESRAEPFAQKTGDKSRGNRFKPFQGMGNTWTVFLINCLIWLR